MTHSIDQHWDGGVILLSYAIAVTGSYSTIQLMEQWRQADSRVSKLSLLALSAVTLGGCGIWCMHFTGMRALHISLDDGTQLEVDFELTYTALSLLFPIVGVFLGLLIASHDPFFLAIEQERRKDLLAKKLGNVTMDKMVKRDAIGRQLKQIALFSRPGFIFGGACWAALGVLGMHYLGMLAQRSNASTKRFDADLVALSCVVALLTATAAFWILFCALTFWPHCESLRFGSAVIMGVAVCGTHYTGMGAASYELRADSYAASASSTHILNGERAVVFASHASFLVCFWSSTFGVMVALRATKRGLDAQTKKLNAVHPEGARTTIGAATIAGNRTTKMATLRAVVGGGAMGKHGGGEQGGDGGGTEAAAAQAAWASQGPTASEIVAPQDEVKKPTSLAPSEASIRPAKPATTKHC